MSADLATVLRTTVVLVAGTGYLVDMFDLFIFNIVRVGSLHDLGLTGENLTSWGVIIINMQLLGIVFGAYVWGLLGDRHGRKKILLGSIVLYSLSALLTGLVQNEWQYAFLRFITGFGLAGELGAGITLISEQFEGRRRGLGVGAFIVFGFLGVLLAAALAGCLSWRFCYFAGGFLGLVLLVLRSKVGESALFKDTRAKRNDFAEVSFGGLGPIFRDRSMRANFIFGVLLLMPSVFVPQLVWSLAPELARARGIAGITSGTIIGLGYGLVVFGDLLAIYLAEHVKSRKKVMTLFSLAGAGVFLIFPLLPLHSVNAYYVWSSLLGLTFGTWIVGSTMIAELFGTNLRATAATTIPNFCRGTAIFMNCVLLWLKGIVGILGALTFVGVIVFTLALAALFLVRESYGRRLDFVDAFKE